MTRFLIAFAALLVSVPAIAGAYAVDNITQTTVRVSGLTCGTKYRVRVERAQGTGWTALETFTPTTAACTSPPPVPTANFAVDPNPAVRTQSVTFTSTGTCAATPCSYTWDHGDATSTDQIGTGATATFTYTGPAGPRTVTLHVTDSLNRSATKTTTFQLVDQPPPAPQCSDGVDNDSDGFVDFPADPGCSSSTDTSETDPLPPPGGFPDASNTGVPAGTTLTKVAGFTVNTPNTVVDGVDTDHVWVNAANVTIRNSYIHGGGVAVNIVSGNAIIQDTTIDCANNGANGIAWDHYTATRVDISGCENGFTAGNNSTIQDSYIHDLEFLPATSHTDGIQSDGPSSNVVVDHNTILARDTSAIIMYTPTDTANRDWSITNNYLQNPDNVDLYCPRINTTGIVITGNHMVYPAHGLGYTDSCVAGHVNTWSGNVDADTGATIPLG